MPDKSHRLTVFDFLFETCIKVNSNLNLLLNADHKCFENISKRIENRVDCVIEHGSWSWFNTSQLLKEKLWKKFSTFVM